ncbi:GDSL-type esterase/lipase family protein [Spirillospora sp. CA-253888]
MLRDLRVCFVGDSFVAGVGDPRHLGWAGRLAARAHAGKLPLTSYNLGVRLQTSADVLARWRAECAPRLRDGDDLRVVFSFGVNDAAHVDGRPRVAAEESAANLAKALGEAAADGQPALVVGPPPIDDAGHNARTALLDERFAEVCREASVPYVPVHRPLLGSDVWTHEVRAGDGAHPGADGYDVLADLVEPRWREWLGY